MISLCRVIVNTTGALCPVRLKLSEDKDLIVEDFINFIIRHNREAKLNSIKYQWESSHIIFIRIISFSKNII